MIYPIKYCPELVYRANSYDAADNDTERIYLVIKMGIMRKAILFIAK